MSDNSSNSKADPFDMDSLETIKDGEIEEILGDDLEFTEEIEEVDEEENTETAIIEESSGLLVALRNEKHSKTETLLPTVPKKTKKKKSRKQDPEPEAKQFDAFEKDAEAEVYSSSKGTGFMRRWFAAWLGIIIAWVGYAAVQHEQLFQAWKPILTSSKISENEHYAFLGAAVFLIAFLLGLIVACFDKSALRCVQLGIAWCAVGIIAVTFLSIERPAKVTADDRVEIGLALIQTSLAPSIHAHALEKQKLNDRIQLLENARMTDDDE